MNGWKEKRIGRKGKKKLLSEAEVRTCMEIVYEGS